MGIGSFSKLFAAASIAGAVLVSSASASTLNVTYQDSSVFGTPNLSQQVSIASPGYTGDAMVGPFRLTGDNGFGDFVAFCVDLTKFMTTGNSYTTAGASAFGATVDSYIDRLFTSSYAGSRRPCRGLHFRSLFGKSFLTRVLDMT